MGISLTSDITKISLIMFTLILGLALQVPLPASAQQVQPPIERSISTYQGHWYGITVTEPTILSINLTTLDPVDDLGIFLFEGDLSQTYDPDAEYFSLAGMRNYFIVNYAFIEGEIAPGTYTFQIVGFNIITEDTISYHLESNVAVEYFGSTFFNTIAFSGVNPTFQSNISSTFLGQKVEMQSFTNWFGWVDEGTVLMATKNIPVTDDERYFASDNTVWTVVEADDHEVTYFHQYKSTVSVFGLNDDVSLRVSFGSIGKVRDGMVNDVWSDWVDEGRSVTVARSIQVSNNERYVTDGKTVLIVDSPIDVALRYHHQWLVTLNSVDVEGINVQFSSMDVQMIGAASTSWTEWIDDNSRVSVDRVISGSGNLERWIAQTDSWIIDAASTINVDYMHQYQPTVSVSGLSLNYPSSISYSQAGQDVVVFSSSTWSDWVDTGTRVRINDVILGRSGERWVTDDDVNLDTSSPFSATIGYAREVSISIVFLDAKGTRQLPSVPTQIIIASPEGVEMELSSYSTVWIHDGAWQINNIDWDGIKIEPISSFSFVPEPGGVWVIPTGVYDISFKIVGPLGLPVHGASVVLTMPNGVKDSASTDVSGIASFSLVPDGEYRFRALSLGQSSELIGEVSMDAESQRQLMMPLSFMVILLYVLISVVGVSSLLLIFIRRRRAAPAKQDQDIDEDIEKKRMLEYNLGQEENEKAHLDAAKKAEEEAANNAKLEVEKKAKETAKKS